MYLFLQTLFLLTAIVVSYINSSIFASETTYITHPLWLELDRLVVQTLIVFQVMAIVGYFVWIVWSESVGPQWWMYILNSIFLLSQTVWPHTAGRWMMKNTMTNKFYTAIPLWVSAVTVAAMTYGTFQSNTDIIPLVASLLVCVTVVLIDGIAWTIRLFQLSEVDDGQ